MDLGCSRQWSVLAASLLITVGGSTPTLLIEHASFPQLSIPPLGTSCSSERVLTNSRIDPGIVVIPLTSGRVMETTFLDERVPGSEIAMWSVGPNVKILELRAPLLDVVDESSYKQIVDKFNECMNSVMTVIRKESLLLSTSSLFYGKPYLSFGNQTTQQVSLPTEVEASLERYTSEIHRVLSKLTPLTEKKEEQFFQVTFNQIKPLLADSDPLHGNLSRQREPSLEQQELLTQMVEVYNQSPTADGPVGSLALRHSSVVFRLEFRRLGSGPT
jgi:hypothetical protein